MPKPMVVISCVERGWQAARTWSLSAASAGDRRVLHIVKGRLPRDVRALMAPRPGVEVLDMPRLLFWPAVFAHAAQAWVSRRLESILVDQEKSARRVAPWAARAGVPVLQARQQSSGTVELEPCASR